MTQFIPLYSMQRRPAKMMLVPCTDADFYIAHRWIWLTWLKQKLFSYMLWWCQPIRAVEKEEPVEMLRIDNEFKGNLLELLRQHQRDCYQMLWDMDSCRVIIGQKQWQELTHQVAKSLSFVTSVDLTMMEQHRRIDGIKVTVVPWIDGMFLLPEEKTSLPSNKYKWTGGVGEAGVGDIP